jgi:hypothetical protein
MLWLQSVVHITKDATACGDESQYSGEYDFRSSAHV